MLVFCRSAKGGSGTTTALGLLALRSPRPRLLVDLAGDLPLALGLAAGDRPGVADWLTSRAPLEHLDDLLVAVDQSTLLLPVASPDCSGTTVDAAPVARWMQLASWCRSWATRNDGAVLVDAPSLTSLACRPISAGACDAPQGFTEAFDHRWLVTRRCYLGVQRATQGAAHREHGCSGIVVVDEPGRGLGVADIERSLGAPVIGSLPWDPPVARAVDAGLLSARRPSRLVGRHLDALDRRVSAPAVAAPVPA